MHHHCCIVFHITATYWIVVEQLSFEYVSLRCRPFWLTRLSVKPPELHEEAGDSALPALQEHDIELDPCSWRTHRPVSRLTSNTKLCFCLLIRSSTWMSWVLGWFVHVIRSVAVPAAEEETSCSHTLFSNQHVLMLSLSPPAGTTRSMPSLWAAGQDSQNVRAWPRPGSNSGWKTPETIRWSILCLSNRSKKMLICFNSSISHLWLVRGEQSSFSELLLNHWPTQTHNKDPD